jgi:hypothetical protein
MSVPNDLEKLIISAAKKSIALHEQVTGGDWFDSGPESFLQVCLAQQISKGGNFSVQLEASPKKVNRTLEAVHAGKPSSNHNQRFDLIVWFKHEEKIRAIIEVKRAWTKVGPVKDGEKIKKYLHQKNSKAKTGYLVVYSVRKNVETMIRMFNNIADDVGGKFITSVELKKPVEGSYWAVGLVRID